MSETGKLMPVDQRRLVRALCSEAIRAHRKYTNIHPEAWQMAIAGRHRGAFNLARKIGKAVGRPNVDVRAPLTGSGLRDQTEVELP